VLTLNRFSAVKNGGPIEAGCGSPRGWARTRFSAVKNGGPIEASRP